MAEKRSVHLVQILLFETKNQLNLAKHTSKQTAFMLLPVIKLSMPYILHIVFNRASKRSFKIGFVI